MYSEQKQKHLLKMAEAMAMPCRICNQDYVTWYQGRVFRELGLCAHENCIIYSPAIIRDATILPFGCNSRSIRVEGDRAARLACGLCHAKGANMGCESCDRRYHFSCGYLRGALFVQTSTRGASFCWGCLQKFPSLFGMFANVAGEMADNGNMNAVVPINPTENGASGSGCVSRRRSRAQTLQPPLHNEEANGNVLHYVEDGNNAGQLVQQVHVQVPMEMVRGDDAADAADAKSTKPLEQNGGFLPIAVIQEGNDENMVPLAENGENIEPLAVNDAVVKDENDENIEQLAVYDAVVKVGYNENIDPLAVCDAVIKEENGENIEQLAVNDAVVKEENGEHIEPLAANDAVVKEENDEHIEQLAANDAVVKEEYNENIEQLAVCDAVVKDENDENIEQLAVNDGVVKVEYNENIDPLAVCDAVIKEENGENIEQLAVNDAVVKEEYNENTDPLAVCDAVIKEENGENIEPLAVHGDLLAAALINANIITANEEDEEGAVGGGAATETIEISSDEEVNASDDDIPEVTLEYFFLDEV